jgi:hypothetical protein
VPSDTTPETVTFEDYERAVLAYMQCYREAGFEVTDVTPVPGQQLRFFASYPNGRMENTGEFVRRVGQECFTPEIKATFEAWIDATRPSEERLQAAREALGECLRDAGEIVPASPSTEDFVRLQQQSAAFADCSSEVGEEFGIPNFGG